MKVTCILGSPRSRGNSSTLARAFTRAAQAAGARVETFELARLDYKGCQGCGACKTGRDRCALQDGLTPVLDAVRETDVLVLATPVYFGDVSSQMKAFIDRTYSFVGPDFETNPDSSRLEKGKTMVFMQSQAAEQENMFADIYPKYQFFFMVFGFETTRLIRALGVRGPNEAARREALLREVHDLAAEVFPLKAA